MEKRTFLDSGLILAVTTAFLYCSSSARLGGFLSPFNLDADMLTRNFQQTLYDGFIHSFPWAWLLLFFCTFLSFIYSHALLPSINDEKNIVGRNRAEKIKQFFLSSSNNYENESKKRTYRFALYTVFSIIIIGYFTTLEKKGLNLALTLLEQVKTDTVNPDTYVIAEINGKKEKLVFLACGDKNCAGIEPNTKTIHYFPQTGHAYTLNSP